MVRVAKERDRLRVAQSWGVSPRRYNGWEPQRVAVYEYEYDAWGRRGKLLRVTEVAESEWDDDTRDLAEALSEYDGECCPGCGFHESVIEDFDNRHFTFDERECPVCAAQSRYGRVVADRDDKATPKDQHGHPAWSSPRERRPDDGRHIYIRELSPAEVQERQSRRH